MEGEGRERRGQDVRQGLGEWGRGGRGGGREMKGSGGKREDDLLWTFIRP